MKSSLLAALSASLLLLGSLSAGATPPASPDPIEGNSKAAVRVIIYQDLECPDCARWHGIFLSTIIPKYGSRVAFEFRDYPLPQHLWSYNAAVLARFFDSKNTKDQNLGMAWRDYCFTHQEDLTPANLLDKAAAWAAPFNITRPQLDAVLGRQDLFALVNADKDLGKHDNLQHTPTILLNGTEATSPEQLESMLDGALRASTR